MNILIIPEYKRQPSDDFAEPFPWAVVRGLESAL